MLARRGHVAGTLSLQPEALQLQVLVRTIYGANHCVCCFIHSYASLFFVLSVAVVNSTGAIGWIFMSALEHLLLKQPYPSPLLP